MFVDECWITCNEHTGRWQYCKPGELPHPIERKARWNVASVMIFSAVGYNYKGPLFIFPSKCLDDDGETRQYRLDASRYIKQCLAKISGELTNPRKHWILLQDGARSHVAKETQAYLKRKGIRWLEDFPPYSPDLNMIESVWKELISAVGEKNPMTMEELMQDAKQAWQDIPQRVINAHCDHWKKALQK